MSSKITMATGDKLYISTADCTAIPNNYVTSTTTTATSTSNNSLIIKGTIDPNPTTTYNPWNLSNDQIKKLEEIINRKNRKMYKEPNYIYKIEEIVPEKVYRFTFGDSTVVKTICSEIDTFDLRYACFLAIAKKLYSKELTFEGVLNEVPFLMYYKHYNKMVDKAIKKFYKKQEEKAKEEEAKRISKRKHDKLVARKIAKKERERQKQVDIIKEAIIAAKEEE